jgi:hypothetical protein
MRLSGLIIMALVALGILATGCSGEPPLAPEDSMESALRDAQKNATPDDAGGKRSLKQKTDSAPPEQN